MGISTAAGRLRFINILGHLGTPHAVIYDDDNGKTFHPEIHKLIGDSRHPIYTRHIEQVKQDLETMLGVRAPMSDHRRPQHIMFLYSTKQIAEANLTCLCEAVERCIRAMA